MTGSSRFDYPARHIEVDNRLSWMLGRLHHFWGEKASYVHLLRDREDVARSFLKRADRGILLAYRTQILMSAKTRNTKDTLLDLCRDYVDTVNCNITHFLADKPRVMTVRLEEIDDDFPSFWNWIGARGNLDAAMSEWDQRHNAS
ncbi:hypothetical protein [Woodsholea maritima]|uniref:hypothetical protein n=1 Tax=Woodsholea maritima TaxID=240237 RepID=UPI001F1A2EF2|nr:hypothetical protein [Woodsholea maritima]